MRAARIAVKPAAFSLVLLVAAATPWAQPELQPPRFSIAHPGAPPAGWQTVMLAPTKQATDYSLVVDDGVVVLKANSHNAASFLAWKTDYDSRAYPLLSWRWKVTQPIPGADTRDRRREDSPARVMVSFAGNPATLVASDRAAAALAEAISGRPLPYSVLMYVWGAKVAPESITVSALTTRIRMIAVAVDDQGVGRWHDYRRNLHEDFRRAFAEEPGRVTAIELMTDTDNTGGLAEAYYGDVSVLPGP
jgi:hypothetical protein